MTAGLSLGLAALALVVGSGVLWFRAARVVALPENRSFYVAVWFAGVVLAGLSLIGSPGWVGGIAALVALLGGALLLFTVAISRQRIGDASIRPGSRIPEFSAPDEHGTHFESSSLAGQPLLLKFFRGHW
ncbi:MAG: hypothetical protein AAGG11_21735 [Pseudomonadota bacterium]